MFDEMPPIDDSMIPAWMIEELEKEKQEEEERAREQAPLYVPLDPHYEIMINDD